MKNLLLSHCHGATVHEGEALAGCKHNWICDECGCMCHAINGSAVPGLLATFQTMLDVLLNARNITQGQCNLLSTATEAEHRAVIERFIDWWNKEAVPLIDKVQRAEIAKTAGE